MAIASETIQIVADALGLEAPTVRSYFREIQKAGLIAKGGRGRAAEHFSPADTARIVITLMGANSLAEAPSIVRLLGGTRCPIPGERGRPDRQYRFDEVLGELFEWAAGVELDDTALHHFDLGVLDDKTLVEVRVMSTDLVAEVYIDDQLSMRFRPVHPVPEPADTAQAAIQRRLIDRVDGSRMRTTQSIDQDVIRRIASGLPGS
ncbi:MULTISPECIES: helix-turn-helix domain-containing protein [Brevundimonas]|jgi:DNA-binding Lrp family transcriptional regulator|uniref:hypothetical protein n=1 Tax=Brevundimonas TaxID=41275 RepID=UPI001749E8F4|nr:hypothetical protein [Brevundimonas aurantiaca]